MRPAATDDRLVPRGSLSSLLLTIWLIVVLAGLAVELVHASSHTEPVERVVGLLSLSYEQNLPTWYATCLLFCAGVALAEIAAPAWREGARFRYHWWGLAAGFFVMSLDEAVELHENLAGIYGGHGVLYFDWVVPAGIVVLLLGLVFVPFLKHLPRITRARFIAAGAIYLTGALLMELPLGWWTERAGPDNLTYAMIDVVEEALELAGVSLFLVSVRAHRLVEDSP